MCTETGNLAPSDFQGNWGWSPSRYTTIYTYTECPHLYHFQSTSFQQVVNFFTGWAATTIYTTTTPKKKASTQPSRIYIYIIIAPKHSSLFTSDKISRNITSSQLCKLICWDDSVGPVSADSQSAKQGRNAKRRQFSNSATRPPN